MAFSAVLEIGDNEVKRYYKQYLLTDLRLVLDRSYTVILSFTVRVNDQLQALRFFKAIISNYVTSLSFLFNATYDPMQRLKDYEDGVVAKGYVVGVEEVYQTDSNASGEFRQMLLNVKLLASSVTYLGYEDNNNLKGVFINNKEEKDKDEERMS